MAALVMGMWALERPSQLASAPRSISLEVVARSRIGSPSAKRDAAQVLVLTSRILRRTIVRIHFVMFWTVSADTVTTLLGAEGSLE